MTRKEQLYEGKAKKVLLTPALYIGRCPEQVSAFVEKIKPLLANADGKSAEINL